jgi:hypothetical protein
VAGMSLGALLEHRVARAFGDATRDDGSTVT